MITPEEFETTLHQRMSHGRGPHVERMAVAIRGLYAVFIETLCDRTSAEGLRFHLSAQVGDLLYTLGQKMATELTG